MLNASEGSSLDLVMGEDRDGNLSLASLNRSLTPWMDGLPSDWHQTRIDAVANVVFSNVDKHTFEHERSVSLCNYVDV
jgi:hypothetical protein